ncbi:helix-turn-helix transcriptional regulator [Streptomyces longispororuber]|uniref:helix-turn-helix transcriptional regulator n=1 Tax=Streptomyces longispororuber TaxID=68230 RepID=UPI001E3BE383|nr:LuxR C-terminal-related transcriptional regulator [Streptomyces longispororuber]
MAGGEPAGRHSPHPADAMCGAGRVLYGRALRAGRLPARAAAVAPCLVDQGLLHPDLDDMRWLLPSPPSGALLRLLRGIEEDVARERHREAELTRAFAPLLALAREAPDHPRDVPAAPLTLHHGATRVADAVSRALDACTHEALTIQPGGFRPGADLPSGPPCEQALLSRGCRVRTLYQDTTRHAFPVVAHVERLQGDVEVRTLSEVTEQLVVLDRAVAFIPAAGDRALALEIRAPALVGYLTALFDRLWDLATPMFPNPPPAPARRGITARQRAIAALLTEGLTDAGIAERLGMNVRTVRAHIAKLSTALGSTSRTQLGYLIGQSGIVGPGDLSRTC